MLEFDEAFNQEFINMDGFEPKRSFYQEENVDILGNIKQGQQLFGQMLNQLTFKGAEN